MLGERHRRWANIKPALAQAVQSRARHTSYFFTLYYFQLAILSRIISPLLDKKRCICHIVADTPFRIQGGDIFIRRFSYSSNFAAEICESIILICYSHF